MLPLQKTPPAREASTCSNWSKLLSINRLHLPQPDLNEEPQRDEIHHLHKDQVHLQEGNEVHQLQGQVQYLYEGEHSAMHAIDLNVPACEGQQQDPLSLLVVVLAVGDDHQQHGYINFHSPNEHNVFDLNLLASDDKLLMAYKMEISSLMVHMITASLTSTYQPQSSNRRCIK